MLIEKLNSREMCKKQKQFFAFYKWGRPTNGKDLLESVLTGSLPHMSNTEQVYILTQLLTQLLVDYQLCAREQVRFSFSAKPFLEKGIKQVLPS